MKLQYLTTVFTLFKQNAQVNLPSDTYLKDVTISDYGGTITGVKTFNISRNGAVHVYPPTRNATRHKTITYNLNTLSILDGGVFYYHGSLDNSDVFELNLEGDLLIRGGGEMFVNNLKLEGKVSVYVRILNIL